MKIALGCDHIVTDTKMKISEHLKDLVMKSLMSEPTTFTGLIIQSLVV